MVSFVPASKRRLAVLAREEMRMSTINRRFVEEKLQKAVFFGLQRTY